MHRASYSWRPAGGRVQRGRSPLWWGAWGTPKPYPLRFPPGKRSESGGKVQRGRSPLWWGLGEPPNPYPLRFPPGKRADLLDGDGRIVVHLRNGRWAGNCAATGVGHLGGMRAAETWDGRWGAWYKIPWRGRLAARDGLDQHDGGNGDDDHPPDSARVKS